jgi:hypothetical protein
MSKSRMSCRLAILALPGLLLAGCVTGPMEGSCRGPRPDSYLVVGQQQNEAAIWIVEGAKKERVTVRGVQ